MRPDEAVHEPADRGEAEEWLAKAGIDLRAAAALPAAAPPLPAVAVFHAQQAVEKSWKALLARHATSFRKTRDLRELGRQVGSRDATLAELAVAAEALTPFAWVFRDPGEGDEPSVAEAREVILLAQRVHDAVRARMS